MTEQKYIAAPRSLVDAISRDLVIVLIASALAYGLHVWHDAASSWASLTVAWSVLFIVGFLLVYLAHEWGHYLGARLAGADIPLGPGTGLFLGLFDPAAHSRRQFMWMAVGGEVGYLVLAVPLVVTFWDWAPFQGLAVAGLAFVVQALSVDIPVLSKIRKGADIQATLEAGTSAPVILRKTAISWGALAIVLAALGMGLVR